MICSKKYNLIYNKLSLAIDNVLKALDGIFNHLHKLF